MKNKKYSKNKGGNWAIALKRPLKLIIVLSTSSFRLAKAPVSKCPNSL